jgi:OOP family OmpA-OmpF porin
MKLKYSGILTALLGLVLVNNVLASEQEGDWYAAGLAVYIDPDSDRNLDNELAGGQLSVGKAFTEHLNFEIEADYLEVDGDGGPGADLTGMAVNGMYVWNRAGRFSPYLLAGVGALNVDPNRGGDDTDFQGQAGPGFLLDLWNDRWAMRAEALGRSSDSNTDLLVNVGIQYAFGGSDDEPAPAPVAAAAPLDSDGDGVTDDIDQCPNTPRGTPVDEVGCPIPVDSDGDGVTDDIDECPDTIKGALVDAVGCGYQLSGVVYGFDSDQLSDDGKGILDEVAVKLEERPEVNITIEGYSDSRGDDAYNQDLSERRAQSAKDELVAKGVAADRITVVGLGEADPIASNDTDEGRAANRRVLLKVDDAQPAAE